MELDARHHSGPSRLGQGPNRAVTFFWTGETDEFDVTSLEGVVFCRNVERIHAAALLHTDDLTPLLGLPKLRSVLLPEPPDGEAFDVIQELERRGVAIR